MEVKAVMRTVGSEDRHLLAAETCAAWNWISKRLKKRDRME